MDSKPHGAEVAGNPAWHFTVVTAAFTAAPMFSPYTFGAGGWIGGSLFWLVSIVTTWLSGWLIGYCVLDSSSRGVPMSYPDMMQEYFGKGGWYFAATMQVITFYLVNISLIVDMANWFLLAQEAGGGGGRCLWEWLLVIGVLNCVSAQIRSFRGLIWFACASLASTVVRQLILYYQVASLDLLEVCEPSYGGVTYQSAFNGLATTAFLFGGHGLFPEEMREMKHPSSFFPAFHWAYAITIALYLSNAIVGYTVWGDWTAGDNQFNFPMNTATFTSAILSSVWGIVEITTNKVMFLKLLENTEVMQRLLGDNKRHLPRIAFRAGIAWSEVFFAWMLNAAGIANLQAFVGSFGFTSLTYYAPFAAYWALTRRRGTATVLVQFGCAVFIAIGLIMMVVGVWSSVEGAAAQIAEYSLFSTATCGVANVLNEAACDNPCRAVGGYDVAACGASALSISR
jgi:hypothetical protein